jgi:2-oxoglutarate/2-oxoacid ferredoxin oxidoreductase subunit beta
LVSDQDIRWCPGCGDFAILKQVQNIIPLLNIPKHKIAFVSGIGCSSRFPYYMNTYGIHSIHGRATSVASGLKIANPDLSVWVVTGDGDALSIGGNHLIHLMRRNIDVNVMLFNNQIYGLTKGQFSPTSTDKLITKSSPFGASNYALNPLALALASGATFIARSIDREAKHLQQTLIDTASHKGTSLIEIYQNCHIYNDGAFDKHTERGVKDEHNIILKHGEPMTFGDNKGIMLDGLTPKIVSLDEYSKEDLIIHNTSDRTLAMILARLGEAEFIDFPRAFGVIYQESRTCFEDQFHTFHSGVNKDIFKDILNRKSYLLK